MIGRPKAERPPDNARLERQPTETSTEHRALLLLAMQDETRRSLRAVALALSRAESGLRNWKRKRRWEERIVNEGATAQTRAIQIYREAYYPSQQMREVSVVERNMSVAFLVSSPPPAAGVGDATRYENKRVEASSEAADDPGKVEIAALRRQGSILDALINRVGKELLANPKLIPSTRELPGLLRARRELMETLGDAAPPQAGPAALEPSARLTEARRTGTSELVAMREDAEELTAILRALEASDRVDQEFAQVAKGPVKLRAVSGISEEEAVFSETAEG